MIDKEEIVKMMKELAKDNLDKWAGCRAETIIDLEERPELETVLQLFRIADEITGVVHRTIDIRHHLTPQIVAVLSSMILGITKGTGIKEVENLVMLKDACGGTYLSGLH